MYSPFQSGKMRAWLWRCRHMLACADHAKRALFGWIETHRLPAFCMCLLFIVSPVAGDAAYWFIVSLPLVLLAGMAVDGLFRPMPMLCLPMHCLCLAIWGWFIGRQVHWSMLWPF